MATQRLSNLELINAVRQYNATFEGRIPKADATNIKNIQEVIIDDGNLYNEFLSTLIDRIGKTLFRDSLIRNRLAWTYTDSVEYGRFIQEIGVQLLKGYDYEMPDNGESLDPFNVLKPDVIQAVYQTNSRRVYQVTINVDLVKRAFTSSTGVDSLISSIVSQLVKSADIDRWLSIKETFHLFITGGSKNPNIAMLPTQKVQVAGYDTKDNAVATITKISEVMTDMGFPRNIYNECGLTHMLNPSDLVLFIRQEALNYIDKNVLAFAFNKGNLSFGDGSIKIEPMDDFGGIYTTDSVDTKVSPTYSTDGKTDGMVTGFGGGVTPETAKYGDPHANVVAVLCDKRRLMVVNNNMRQEVIWNPKGLYTNYFQHDWNTFTQSAMCNAVVFYTGSELNPSAGG